MKKSFELQQFDTIVEYTYYKNKTFKSTFINSRKVNHSENWNFQDESQV